MPVSSEGTWKREEAFEKRAERKKEAQNQAQEQEQSENQKPSDSNFQPKEKSNAPR